MTNIVPYEGIPFTLVGFAHPKPDKVEELRELLLSFVAPTREEHGALEYHFHELADDPTTFVFYEVWRSAADLDRHLALPHMREFWEHRMDYLERDLEIHYLTMRSPYPRPMAA
ncbi:putative quinol monooxygenase [Nocardia otitidiscaviarum]|uniref:putative quinol monooxygenase n=1 Tax=Nocardia otitidiscaviarum TaxID=1823 RepID=UPI0018955717|nr:putative quinol monooxygenase [Nocardia otitidiscaviarum]MBF6180473.1 antibiotic biosynthesis monooxygenase [Nocardia otitidiscaviarum]